MNDPVTLDLSELDFLPAWAKQPEDPNRYAEYTGDSGGGDFRDGRHDRRRPHDRGDARRGPREQGRDRGPRRDNRGDSRGRTGPAGPRNDRPPGPGAPRNDRDRGPRRDDRRDDRRGPRRDFDRDRTPMELPNFEVGYLPDGGGVEKIASQIKLTGRAYPLFDLARLILRKQERYRVTLKARAGEDGTKPALFVCASDESVWLSEGEAIQHCLRERLNDFYSVETVSAEPPKGNFNCVAVCGLSGVILGPPNHHDYQTKLRSLYRERFGHMSFDAYRNRVKTVRDEATVQKWQETVSQRTEHRPVSGDPPESPLLTFADVEADFKKRFPDAVRRCEHATLPAAPQRVRLPGPLYALVRQSWEEQLRFPIKVATVLSQQFSKQGLRFFKLKRNTTFVGVARPVILNTNTTAFSVGIRRILDFIQDHPGASRENLLQTLAPAPPAPEPASETPAESAQHSPSETPAAEEPLADASVASAADAPCATNAPSAVDESATDVQHQPAATSPAAAAPAPVDEAAHAIAPEIADARDPDAPDSTPSAVDESTPSEVTSVDSASAESAPVDSAAPADSDSAQSVRPAVADEASGSGQQAPPAPAAAAAPEPHAPEFSPAQLAVLSDLRWLLRQGFLVEFANGKIESSDTLLPQRPKKPAKVDQPGSASAPTEGEVAQDDSQPTSASAEPEPIASEPAPHDAGVEGDSSVRADASESTETISTSESPAPRSEEPTPAVADVTDPEPVTEPVPASDVGPIADPSQQPDEEEIAVMEIAGDSEVVTAGEAESAPTMVAGDAEARSESQQTVPVCK